MNSFFLCWLNTFAPLSPPRLQRSKEDDPTISESPLGQIPIPMAISFSALWVLLTPLKNPILRFRLGIPVHSCLLHCVPPTICWREPPSPTGGVIEQDKGRTNKTPSLTSPARTIRFSHAFSVCLLRNSRSGAISCRISHTSCAA